MAQQTTIHLVDDLDGRKAHETVTFMWNGVEYEIDLSTAHATRLRARLAKFVAHARRVRTPSTPSPAPGRRGKSRWREPGRPERLTPTQAATVRAWARDQGHEISPKGRLPEHTVNTYFKTVARVR